MKILIKNRQRRIRVRSERLEGLTRKALQALGLIEAEVSILLVNDIQMQELNRLYRNKDKTTDVLAFPMKEGIFCDINPYLLGDIVISLPTAGRQAKEKGHGIYKEIAVLLIHGLFHLCGYDHEKSRKEEQRMRRKERKILSSIDYI